MGGVYQNYILQEYLYSSKRKRFPSGTSKKNDFFLFRRVFTAIKIESFKQHSDKIRLINVIEFAYV